MELVLRSDSAFHGKNVSVQRILRPCCRWSLGHPLALVSNNEATQQTFRGVDTIDFVMQVPIFAGMAVKSVSRILRESGWKKTLASAEVISFGPSHRSTAS